jgi:putative transposase
MTLARKSIQQRFHPGARLLAQMECFRLMTNDCIRIGLEFEIKTAGANNGQTASMKRLSLMSYGELRKRYGGYSQYALCAISRAAGILSARRKSVKRGVHSRNPYISKPGLASCYGFKIENGNLVIHIDAEILESIPLNSHTKSLLSDPTLKVRSFTLTTESLSLCVTKDIKEMDRAEITGSVGVDRNLRNLTVGNATSLTYYDMTEAVGIAETTRDIIRSFKRADLRIRQQLASKYGKRRSDRTKQFLNLVSKRVVKDAKARRQAIVFEDIRGIRKLYRRGNGQGRSSRGRMNSWPFHEIKRQIEYKAAWEGIPVITLTRRETRGTTTDCPRCGERLQVPIQGDEGHYRQLWCEICKRWRDRDLVAVLNISRRGWSRFDHSSNKEGEAGETVKGNAEHEGEPLILRVDASKLRCGQKTQ